MKSNNPFSAELLRAAVLKIRDDSVAEDDVESTLISNLTSGAMDVFDDDDSFEEVPPVFSLKNIAVENWDGIVLSRDSKFGDPLWDFTSYPHVNKKQVRINFDYINLAGINLIETPYWHWERILKALVFYRVPHFAASNFVRSYGALSSKKTQVLRLIPLFKQHGLYCGQPGSESFCTLNDISRDLVTKFIQNQSTPGMRWEVAHLLQFWQKLSRANLLPPEYTLLCRFVTKEEVARYRKEYDDQTSPYMPIPLDDYAEIVAHCVRLIEQYSPDILWLYDTYYPAIVGAYEHPERAQHKPGGFSPSTKEGVDAFLAYAPYKEQEAPWWPLTVQTRSKGGVADNMLGHFINLPDIISLIASLLDACCTIILATTGMRRSEVMGLLSGCSSCDRDGFWLTYTVFKTSKASQGDVKKIPIPPLAAKAVELVERLCHESRVFGGHNKLFASFTRQHFGMETHAAYPERAVKRVAEAAGADQTVHPHRFRKTLAMYLIYLDPQNIEVIRQLFSHVSIKMTLRYLMSLPGVNDEMKRIIAEQNVDVLLEIIGGALNGRIGGEAGKRVRKSLENAPDFAVKLQDKGRETLTQYVESMLEQGIRILHRTNLAICMKTPGYTEAAPCDAKDDDPSTKLHPNLFACDPFNCRFAAFVENNASALESEIIFHNRLIKHPFTGADQKRFSQRRVHEASKRLIEVGGVVPVSESLNG